MATKKVEYKVWWDDKDKIGRIVASGVLDEKTTREIVKAAIRIIDERKENMNWIADLKHVTRPIFSASLRKDMAEALKASKVEKIAIIGAATVVRVVTNFILTAAGHKSIRFFPIEAEAFEWFKGN